MNNKSIKEVSIFFALVLGLSYFVFWGPIALFQVPTISFNSDTTGPVWALILFILGGFIPSILGLILTYIYDQKKGVSSLIKSTFNFRIGYKNYILIFIIFILIGFFTVVINMLLGNEFDFSLFISESFQIIPLFILGPLSEELGWRGFAQKRLTGLLSPFKISIVIGLVWSLWHLPLFYMVGSSQSELGMPFTPFLIKLILISMVYTHFYNKTNKSVFSAVLIHWIYTYLITIFALGLSQSVLMEWLSIIPLLLFGIYFSLVDMKNRSLTE